MMRKRMPLHEAKPLVGCDEFKDILARAQTDPGAAFEDDALAVLLCLKNDNPAEFERAWAALKKCDVNVTRLGKHLEKMEANASRRETNGAANDPAFDIREIELEAKKIIGSNDVLGLFVNDWHKVVAGEEKNARLLYLIATSRLLPKTMHVAVKGPSSAGKSEIRSRILDFFPPDSVIAFTSLSERALLYMKDPFEHKILSMGEAQDPKEQTFQDYLLRELMSEGKLRYPVAQKIGDEVVTVTIEKDGPVVFMVTTTRLKLHAENETRMLSIDVDDSEAQTRGVLDKVAEVEGLGMLATVVDYAPWHAFQRWLEFGERRVTVPFALALAKAVPPMTVRLRRDFGQVLRAIKAHALIHRNHRDRDEHGRIVANIENDYIAVRSLMNDLLAETAEVKIKDTVQQTVDAVTAMTKKMMDDDGVTAVAVGKFMKLDKSVALRRLRNTENAGLIENLETHKGRPGKFRPTNEIVETAQMLPTPESLNVSPSIPSETRATVQPPRNGSTDTTTSRLQSPMQPNNGCATATAVAIDAATNNSHENKVVGDRLHGCSESGGEEDKFTDAEQRAAIADFDGGIDRKGAEAMAGIDAIDDNQMPPIPDFLLRTE